VVIYTDRPYEFNDQEFVGYLLVMGFFLFVVDRFGISMQKTFYTVEEQRQQLAVERERMQVTLRSIGDAVIATDVRGNITFVNAVAEQITGWDANEAIGQPLSRVFDIINEESRQPVESPFSKVIRTGAIVGLANHTILIRKNGREVPIDDSGAPIRDGTGALAGIILVFRDISVRRQTEKDEAAHRKLVDTLLETTQTINSSFDLEEVVEFILEKLQRIMPTDFSYVMLLKPARIFKTQGYEDHGEKFQKAFTELSEPVRQLSRLRLMVQTREPLLVSDTREKKDWLEFPHGEPLPSFLGVPIIDHEEVIGFIGLHSTLADYFQPNQVRRLQFFATQFAIVIQNKLLAQKEQELAILEERQRLARDLHDSVTQMLFASSVIAKTLPQMMPDIQEEVLVQLKKLQRFNQGTLADMRRLLLELRQTDMASIPLPELIQQLATAIMGNSAVDIHLNVTGESTLPPDIHVTFYKISQEALNNIVKHANATRVDIQLDLRPDSASLVIKDDGGGFDPAEVRSTHMGLKIMQERADMDEAELEVNSKPGEGTELRLSWTID
jgi:PAS domain S-box-containing protein